MFLLKLRTVAATLITITAAGRGSAVAAVRAHRLPGRSPTWNRSGPSWGLKTPVAAGQAKAARKPGRPPEISPGPTSRLPTGSASSSSSRHNPKATYEKIKTWQGTYGYVLRQYLDEKFRRSASSVGARRLADKPAPQDKPGPLMQEFDSALTFAIDMGKDSIYRDIETSRMRFLKVGTNEEVRVPERGSPGPSVDRHAGLLLLSSCRRSGPRPRSCQIIRTRR